MAEEQTEGAQAASPQATADGPISREALLAELAALPSDEGEPQASPEPAGEEPVTEEAPAPEADSAGEEAAKADAEEQPEEDPQALKGIEAIKRQHKREKEKLDRDRREMELERDKIIEEWKPLIDEAQKFKQAKARAKYDPASVLESVGLTPEDFEAAARQIYARSKAAAANPQTREAAERAMREREAADRLAGMERELEALRQEREHERRQQTQERQVQTFLSGVEKAVTAETPLLRALLENDPQDAREQIAALAVEIIEDTGEAPDAIDVVTEFEKRQRARLKKLGLDTAAPQATPKTKTPPAGETKRPMTLSNDLSTTSTKPRSPATDPTEEREDILKGLRELRD